MTPRRDRGASLAIGAMLAGSLGATACGGGPQPITPRPAPSAVASTPKKIDPCPDSEATLRAIADDRAHDRDLAALAKARTLVTSCPALQDARWQLAEILAELWVFDEARDAYKEYGDRGSPDEKKRAADGTAKLVAGVPATKNWKDLGDDEKRKSLNDVKVARAALDGSDYASAKDQFEHAYREWSDPQSLAFIGRASEKSKDAAQASLWYARALAVAESTRGKSAVPKISTGYADEVNALAFSVDGNYIAAGSSDHFIRAWDLSHDNREIFSAAPSEDEIRSVAFSPDGSFLASGSRDGHAKLFDFASGREVVSFDWIAPINSVAFAPDGSFLATGTADGAVRLWDVKTGGKTRLLAGRSTEVLSIAFAPDARACGCGPRAHADACRKAQSSGRGLPPEYLLAAGTAAGTVELWRIARTAEGPGDVRLLKTVTADKWSVRSLAFSPDGSRLATAGGEGTTKVFNACGGDLTSPLTINKHKYWANAVAFNSDGSLLADAATTKSTAKDAPDEYVVEVTHPATGHAVNRIATHTDIVNAVAFSPTALGLLASAGNDGKVTIVHVDDESEENSVAKDVTIPFDMSVTADGATVVECGRDKAVTRWSLASGERTPIASHDEAVTTCSMSARERLVASASGKIAKLTDLATGKAVATLAHMCRVGSAALSPDERIVVTGCGDGTVTIWDTASASVLGTIDAKSPKKHTGSVDSIAFAPDGKSFFTGSGDKTIRAWDASTFMQIGEPLLGHTDDVYSLAVSPDGATLASGSFDDTIKLFNLRSPGDAPKNLAGHTQKVRSVIFTPDGKQLLSTGWDETIRVWDVAAAKQIGIFPRLSSPGRKLTFRKDGKVLYALTRDGQMRLFSTSPDYKEVATLFGAGTDWVVASVTGEVDSSPNGRDSIYWQVGDVQFRYYVAWARQSRPGLLAHLLDGLR